MFSPSKMFLFRSVIQEKQAELLLFPLLDRTDIHFVDFESVQPEEIDIKKFVVLNEYNEIKSIEDKLQAIDHMLHFAEHRPEFANYDFLRVHDHHDDIQRLTEITDKYFALLNKLNARKNRLEELSDAGDKMKTLEKVDNVFTLDSSSILFYKFGYLATDQMTPLQKSLQRVPVIVNPLSAVKERSLALLVGMNKNKAYIDSALHSHNWEDVDLSREFNDFRDVYKDLEGARELCRKDIEELSKQLEMLVNQSRDYIYEKYWEFHYLRLLNDIKGYFKRSKGNVYLAFWAPEAEKQKVIDTIRKVTHDKCYIEGIEALRVQSFLAGKIKIPILFKNKGIFKTFELFVNAYNVPAYGTIDPTIVFTFTYMLMFGFMFCDLGHGLVLSLLGVFGLLKTKWPRKLCQIFVYCGISSMIFGTLFGSFFGFENVIPAIWMRPMDKIMFVLALSVVFGILYILLALAFNLINSWIMKDLKRGVFDNHGLLGGLFYFSVLGILAYLMILKHSIHPAILLILIGLPIILLFLKGPILFFLKKEHVPFEGGFMVYFIESCVQIFELFTGYLSNTISFARVGGFALSHSGLILAVFVIEGIVKTGPMGGVLQWVVIIGGNLLIIVLEAFLSGIQVLRLQFYEFLTKFYREGELVFKPVKLK